MHTVYTYVHTKVQISWSDQTYSFARLVHFLRPKFVKMSGFISSSRETTTWFSRLYFNILAKTCVLFWKSKYNHPNTVVFNVNHNLKTEYLYFNCTFLWSILFFNNLRTCLCCHSVVPVSAGASKVGLRWFVCELHLLSLRPSALHRLPSADPEVRRDISYCQTDRMR